MTLGMRIGELAERAGTTTRTLRYYESLGLLPAHRDGNGYRSYDESALRLLRQIQTLRDVGFGLEETRPFVDCLRAGHPAGDSCPASLAVYRRKLAELDDRLARLTAARDLVRAQLDRALDRAALAAAADVPGGPPPRCELTDAPAGSTPPKPATPVRATAVRATGAIPTSDRTPDFDERNPR
jgi:DNA-binding transcriptional MerR regulator